MGIGVKICELGGSLAEWNKCEFWGRTDLCVHPPLSCVVLGTWGGLSELDSESIPVTCGGNQGSLQACPGVAEIQPLYGAGLNLRDRILREVEIALLLCQVKGATADSCPQGCVSNSGGDSEASYMFRV